MILRIENEGETKKGSDIAMLVLADDVPLTPR